jgi:GntR family transcriptional regulator
MAGQAGIVSLRALAIDRSSATPVYRQIAEHIEAALRDGGGGQGMRLPSEEALSDLFQVNRATIRRTLLELVRLGTLVQSHGRGSYVTDRRILEQPLASSLISFSEALKALNIPFATRTVSASVIRPAPPLAARLRTTDEVYAIRRVRSVEAVPVLLVDNFVPRALCPDLTQRDLESNQLFATLARDYGIEPYDGDRTFEATLARRETAELLDIAVGDPVMFAEQTTRRRDGTPIEASDMWIPGRRFKLSAHIFRQSPKEGGDDAGNRRDG